MANQYSDQKFCPMPWLHLHIDTQGKIRACCSTPITFGDADKDSLSEIWEGKSINDFRQLVLEKGVDNRCAACLNREAAGKASMRTETIAKFPELTQSIIDGKEVDIKPVYLDIRFSNLCNLRCRTCWHGASSSWFEEAKLLGNTAGKQAIIKATEDNHGLIKEVMKLIDEVKEVYFAGGEPLMMEEHYELLDQLRLSGQQPLLRYNTNLSRLQLKDESVLEYWQHFDQVQVSVSIDEMEGRGEYVRKGLKWPQLLENMRLIQTQCPHVKLEIAPTVSVFNVDRLGEMHRFFVEAGLIGVNDIYLNMLDRPLYYNIVHLRDEQKADAKETIESHLVWLRQHQAQSAVIKEFQSIIDYLYSRPASPKYQMQFRQKTKELDRMRKENYDSLF